MRANCVGFIVFEGWNVTFDPSYLKQAEGFVRCQTVLLWPCDGFKMMTQQTTDCRDSCVLGLTCLLLPRGAPFWRGNTFLAVWSPYLRLFLELQTSNCLWDTCAWRWKLSFLCEVFDSVPNTLLVTQHSVDRVCWLVAQEMQRALKFVYRSGRFFSASLSFGDNQHLKIPLWHSSAT